jgi:branched-chain amino acid transport system ATP-binding protein
VTPPVPGAPRAGPPRAGPILDLREVDVYYGGSHVLQRLSFAAAQGAVTCLLGRNGAGKTTAVRAVMGLTPPRRGRIAFDGRDITGAPPHRIARLGVALVPQGRGIFPDLTVRQQLDLAARPGAWPLARIYETFPSLRERERRAGAALSGGEQQMLAIARALRQGPRLLVMDEPTEGLAPLLIERLREVLCELRGEGLSILLVEQHVPLALAVADRVCLLGKGRLVFEGTPAQLRADPAAMHQYLGV